MAQLECKNLCLGYDGKTIRENLSFSVNEGDYLCIVGENGSGKSTLIKTILGLCSPISGEIKLDKNLKEKGIGYLPQQTEIQKDFPATVFEIVISGCVSKLGIHPFFTKEEKNKACEMIDRLHLNDLKKRCYKELSGGQQQRVLLARALCATEKIVLLDEPVAGLDPKVTAEMYDIIEELNKKYRVTVIMISHDISAAIGYATHILHIGNTPFFGTKTDYLKNELSRTFCIHERHDYDD